MNKATVLKAIPTYPVMHISGVFCFLWDDPLFTFQSSIEEWELKDPEFIELRRQQRLLALEVMYLDIDRLKEELAAMKEIAARGVWTWKQLIDHVPADVRKRVLIEGQVNNMDPDFSFCKAIGME